ncbi:non-ribosomal peptide synthetase, partial [Mycobacterium sp. ITM-2017-0098]
EYRLTTRPPGAVQAGDVLTVVDASAQDALSAEVVAALDRIDPATGSLVQAVVFTQGPPTLLLCVHHLATDVVSWYVIVGALAQLAGEIDTGITPSLTAEYTTYRQWTRSLHERSHSDDIAAQRDYWVRQLCAPDPLLGSRLADPARDTWASLRLTDVVT